MHGVCSEYSFELIASTATGALHPEPINFNNQKLNRTVPVVDLRRYDALLFEDNQLSASEIIEVPHAVKPGRDFDEFKRTET